MSAAVSIDFKHCRRPNCRKPLGPKDPRDGAQAYLCSDCRSSSLWSGLTPRPPAPRAFTAADRAFIRKVSGFMPTQQLLEVLNERLQADVGNEVAPYTLEQLHAELATVRSSAPEPGAADWAALRKLLAQARAAGTLERISVQTIDDFAVVYSLTPAQVLRLKDVILTAGDQP